MNSYLEEILKQGKFVTEAGQTVEIHSHISQKEGELLQDAIASINAEIAVEIGCAFGISSIFISEALKKTEKTCHYIIDPSQMQELPEGWGGFGIYNLNKAGFQNTYKYINESSHLALPNLEMNGIKADFGFIDGWHTFDHTLVDFFHLDKVLRVGGLLAIDDTNWESVQKVCSFIIKNRSYSLFKHLLSPKYPPMRAIANSFYKIASGVKVLSPYLASESYGGKIDKLTRGGFIILKKESDDIRNWDHFVPF